MPAPIFSSIGAQHVGADPVQHCGAMRLPSPAAFVRAPRTAWAKGQSCGAAGPAPWRSPRSCRGTPLRPPPGHQSKCRGLAGRTEVQFSSALAAFLSTPINRSAVLGNAVCRPAFYPQNLWVKFNKIKLAIKAIFIPMHAGSSLFRQRIRDHIIAGGHGNELAIFVASVGDRRPLPARRQAALP